MNIFLFLKTNRQYIYIITGLFVSLILIILIVFNVYAAPNTPQNIKTVSIYEEQVSDEYFTLRNKNTVSIKITTSFELVRLFDGHSNAITAMPCVVGRTYRKIIDVPINEIKDNLEAHKHEVIREVYQCMKEVYKAEISKLNITYGDIVFHGDNYSPPLPENYTTEMKPMTFEEWKAKQLKEQINK